MGSIVTTQGAGKGAAVRCHNTEAVTTGGGSKKCGWKARVTFVPFESENQRDAAYRAWVRLFLESQRQRALKPGKERGMNG
ncbi:MAG: hypothetical protein JRJ03_19575 [Deltaproteobacteria bacterium]|nr:hypothetical protein [Deltaproteobacteria bacterium]